MVSAVASTHCAAELERVGKTSARLRVPVDLTEVFGRARPPLTVTVRSGRVTGTVDGVRQGKHR